MHKSMANRPIEYRKARCTDTVGIHAVEEVCFSSPWSLESFESELCHNPLARYVVASDADIIVGFCGLHAVFDEGHITNVAVMPEYRGCGIAKKMLNMLFALTAAYIQYYTLEVRVSNTSAIALYHQLGFREEGRRLRYYEDNGEDAIIMWRIKSAIQ